MSVETSESRYFSSMGTLFSMLSERLWPQYIPLSRQLSSQSSVSSIPECVTPRSPHDDQRPALVTIPYFEELSKTELSKLTKFFTSHRYEPNEAILAPQDTSLFHVIVRGQITLYSTANTQLPLKTLLPGEWFGDMALVENSYIAVHAVSSCAPYDATVLLSITHERFNEFCAQNPLLTSHVKAETRFSGISPPVVQLRELPLFSVTPIDEFKLQQLGALFAFVRVKPANFVFRQGDDSDGFYILVKGVLTVTWTRPDGKEIFLDTLTAGAWFGEISLIQQTKRTASVTAVQQSILLFLGPTEFHKFMSICPELQGEAFRKVLQQRTTNMLKTIPFFSPLITKRIGPLHRFDEEKLSILSQMFYYQTFDAGETVFREKEKGDSFYIIITGKCERSVNRHFDGETVSFGELIPGDFFGELALIGDMFRTDTVVALERTTCLKLDKEHFTRFFQVAPELKGPIMYILKMRTGNSLLKIPFFRNEIKENKPWSKLSLLGALFDYEQVSRGEIIMNEGEFGEKFYLIVIGLVEICARIDTTREDSRNDAVRFISGERFLMIDELQAGDYFGEVALMTKTKKRIATVIARETCVFLSLTRERFCKFLSLVPEAKKSMRKLSMTRAKNRESSLRDFSSRELSNTI